MTVSIPTHERKTNNGEVFVPQLSSRDIAQLIGSFDAEKIEAIAEFAAAQVMDRLWIDVEITNRINAVVDFYSHPKDVAFACAKKYDKNSNLMKLLLPIFVKQITEAFSTPDTFVENGIVFKLVTENDEGILDKVEDDKLKDQIIKGMRNDKTFSLTIEAIGVKKLILVMKLLVNGGQICEIKSSVDFMMENRRDSYV